MFGLIPVEGDQSPLPPMEASSYGPFVADLVALADPTDETIVRLGKTLGFEWLVSLVEIGRPEDLNEPALGAFLRNHYALRPGYAPNPYGVRARKLVRKRPRQIPRALITEFTTSEAERLRIVGDELKRLVEPLLASARGDPQPADQQHERATVLLNALDSPMPVHKHRDVPNQRSVYCSVPTTLYARALLEVIELYNDTPPVAMCTSCDRLFVPQRNDQRHCRRYVWPGDGGEIVAGCIYDKYPSPARAQLDSEARRREYKKRQMRLRRMTQEYGPDAESTRRAREEFEEWKRTNPINRGRRPKPMSPDILPND
jgi:hypothetical protein